MAKPRGMLDPEKDTVFISYARSDTSDFAQRLVADLRERGARPWIDTRDIASGDLFDVRIEQAIRSTSVFLAVMSPASLRDRSVCRDEIIFALNQAKTVVPVKAHAEVRPPLLLARRNWVDFSVDYNQGLGQLVSYLSGNPTGLLAPRFPTVTGAAPFDFGPEIARFSAGFTGRRWLEPEIDRLASRTPARAIIIVGDRGIGKSAIAAWLAEKCTDVAAVHFCTRRNTRTLDPYEFVSALVGQLCARLPVFADCVERRIPESRRRTASDAFRELVVEPALEVEQGGALTGPPQLLIIDSLDEAITTGGGETVLDVVVEQANSLPPWLRIVATTQPESSILDRIRTLQIHELSADRPENRADLRAYVLSRARMHALATVVAEPSVLVNRIEALSAGNFLYAKTVFDALDDGSLTELDIGNLAPGLSDYFAAAFRRRFKNLSRFAMRYAPLLRPLAVSEEPIPFTVLRELADTDSEDLNRRLRDLRSYLHTSHSGTTTYYSLYHQSVCDWLTAQDQAGDYWCDPVKGHAQLAKTLLRNWRGSNYALRHVLSHLVGAGQAREAVDLCRRDGGAFLRECVAQAGLPTAEGPLRAAFVSCLVTRWWFGAAASLVLRRWLSEITRPVSGILKVLLYLRSDGEIHDLLHNLDRIGNRHIQMATAVLAAVRFDDAGHEKAANALLRWVGVREWAPHVSRDTPVADVCDAVLLAARIDLVEKVVALPVFENSKQRLRVLAALLARAPKSGVRSEVLATLQADPGDLGDDHETVERIARQAIASGDQELSVSSLQWLGKISARAGVELLGLTKLAEQPEEVVLEAARALSKNPRLERYPAIRAGVAAFVLMGPRISDSGSFMRLSSGLARTLDVSVEEIRRQMAADCRFATELWGMTPSQFNEWLSARIAFLIGANSESDGKQLPDQFLVAAFRRFVSRMCTVLRWVATQAENGRQDKSAVESCLTTLSILAWRNPKAASPPFLESSGKRLCDLRELDPVCASLCLRTANWLASAGFLNFTGRWAAERENRAAAHDILQNLLAETVERESIAGLEDALVDAWRVPAPQLEQDLSQSPWLPAYKAIANLVGVSWAPTWSGGLERKYHRYHDFPARLVFLLKKLRQRIIELAEEQGWHPCLLSLGLNVARLLGEDDFSDEELEHLLLPAIEAMDSDAARDCPNDEAWPPVLLPLYFSRRVPDQLADAMAAMELTDRGLLWRICEGLCQKDRAPDWWDSVRRFRDTVRNLVLSESARPLQKWSRAREDPQELLEAALAPINLILDKSCKREDFDRLLSETNVNEDSHWYRLKALVRANPRAEILEWTVAECEKRSGDGLWLLEHLIRTRRFDLIYRLFVKHYGEKHSTAANYLSGFDLLQEPKMELKESPSYLERLSEILGFVPGEGLLYGIEGLAKSRIAGTLDDDETIQSPKESIRLLADWERQLSDLLDQKDPPKDFIVRTLLVISILSGNDRVAKFAEQLVSSELTMCETFAESLLWLGLSVTSELVTEKWITFVCQSGSIEVLAALGDWDAVRRHLLAQSTRGSDAQIENRLLHWYRACTELEPAAQLTCLTIYCEFGPPLLADRYQSTGHDAGSGDLRPVSRVSSSLRYESYSLPPIIAQAGRYGVPGLQQAWFRSVLIEAQYGPDRREDLKCLETVCACAGSLEEADRASDYRQVWLEFVSALSKKFDTRSLWRSWFRGVALRLGRDLGSHVLSLAVPQSFTARLALAEILAQYGDPESAEAFCANLVKGSQYPWLVALRASEAFLFVETSNARPSVHLGAKFVTLAWEAAATHPESDEPALLATLLKRAVQTRCELVLSAILQRVDGDVLRGAALGRIALDVFLSLIEQSAETDSRRHALWALTDLVRNEALRQLILKLVEETASNLDSSNPELGSYDHHWSHDTVGEGIGWLGVILGRILDEGAPTEMVAWVAEWIGRIPAEKDEAASVAKSLVAWLEKSTYFAPTACPLFDFAVESLRNFHGPESKFVELIAGLLRAQYRRDDLLKLFDDFLIEHSSYRIWAIQKIAVACAQNSTDQSAERYLSLLPADNRALARDEISEGRHATAIQRLEGLLAAPRSLDVLDRIADLVTENVDTLALLDDAGLRVMGMAVNGFRPSSKLGDRVARALNDLLEPSERIRLVDDANSLSAIQTAVTQG